MTLDCSYAGAPAVYWVEKDRLVMSKIAKPCALRILGVVGTLSVHDNESSLLLLDFRLGRQ